MAKRHRGVGGREGRSVEHRGRSFPYWEVYGRHLRPVLTPRRDETANARSTGKGGLRTQTGSRGERRGAAAVVAVACS